MSKNSTSASDTEQSADQPIDPRKSLFIAFLVAGAFFMENLDGTVIATAIPQMAHSFGTSPVGLNIGITAYLLSLAMFIPMSGWVADRFGARTVFGSAVALFTLSSILCGLCNGVVEFTAMRILQGFGGAMMVPVGRLVVLRNTAKRDLVTAIAYVTWPGLVAPIVGPPLGGFITTYASWRWIFFLNVPLGILALIFTLLLIPNVREPESKPFDWVGFFLSGATCLLLIYGLDLVGRAEVSSIVSGSIVAASILLGTFAVRHFQKHSYPLIDLSALRVQTFAITIWGASLFRIAIGATPFLLPLMFQVGFGMNAVTSGFLTLAVFAGNLLMKPATTPILRRFGFKKTMIYNGIFTAITFATCCFLFPTTPKFLIIIVLFVSGLCRSMQFTCLNTVGFSDIPPSEMSAASTLSSTVQQVTLAMGVAFGAIALRIASFFHGASGRTPTTADFHLAFGMVALIGLASIYDYFNLPSNAGQEISGQATPRPAR